MTLEEELAICTRDLHKALRDLEKANTRVQNILRNRIRIVDDLRKEQQDRWTD